MSVSEISDDTLLERAVRSARARSTRKGVKHPRWTAVMDAFSLGSTYSRELCRRFGLNPDEMVKR
ncbi:hypothetical protein [Labrenzia sp. DG1229]|uniref:hypothetical protein n=1 Tax=Labrenzia sp. DG1229 TaxID=681847 RepID=UPI0012EC5E11|nr:hypothetical protein [Labrenzia sp. DG1229]